MSLLADLPQFTAETAAQLAAQLYHIHGTATPLPSERDQNFRITPTGGGSAIVLKIASAREDATFLRAQLQAMAHIHAGNGRIPAILPTQDGSLLTSQQSPTGQRHLVWAIHYLPGKPLGDVGRHSPALRHDIGHTLGHIDRLLATFDHPAAHRHFYWDLQHAPETITRYLPLVADDDLRQTIATCLATFQRHSAPHLPGLRRSLIHNDANDYNLIVGHDAADGLDGRFQTVLGLIDFGDMVHSYTLADLAVAIAYAILDQPDPLAAAAPIVAGYHAAYPLPEHELSLLFPLVCLRLCLSACLAASHLQQRPDDPYLAISQAPIRRTLPRLLALPAGLATAVFRHACGLPPPPPPPPKNRGGPTHPPPTPPKSPHTAEITGWLHTNRHTFAPILPIDVRTAPIHVLDLSVASPLLHGDAAHNRADQLTPRIEAAIAAAGADVGIGQYDEPRLIYTAPFFATGSHPTAERRTIHLGLDLFAPAGTAVHAPLPGTIHALANNAVPQDYGPVVVVRHQTDAGRPFFTLYGHLSTTSLANLRVGQHLAAGEPFAALGIAAENVGWPPHLHFQILTDTLGLDTDFPGVAPASQRDIWRGLSPDPNLILGIPAHRFPPAPPAMPQTLAARQQRLGGNLSIAYRNPVKIVRGWMQYLYDENGRCYRDAYNNVPHVGHAHPHVVAAGQQQMAILNTNTRYLHDLLNTYAERLAATLPDPLSVCYFVNSASEANELALRLARAATGQRDMIVLEAAYHGHTTSLIDISPYKHDGPGGQGAPAWVHTAPIPDTYRGPIKADDPQAGATYARHVASLITRLQAAGRGLAGYIAESLPSVGGQIVPPPGYLAAVYAAVRAAGGVCIADEVQTGYGRIGTHFYGFEMQGVVPDIVVLGKPIGNGHPIGAVITTPDIAAAFDNGMEFFSTFGGSTLSCAIGLAVLDVVQAEELQAHALAVGERLLAGLRPLQAQYPLVGDVRGSGLFLGVELVHNRETLAPAGDAAAFIANQMRQRGILLGTDGPHHNVIKIRPPMPFAAADADLLVETFADILAADFRP